MADPAWFAGRLREVREAAGLTQADLASRAGLTREGVAQLETGRRKPAWESVLALAKALGVSCEDFTKEPEDQPSRTAGRPPKPKDAEAEDAPKRGKGRPSKEKAEAPAKVPGIEKEVKKNRKKGS